ncbi:type III-B CRISPR module RAMP protein Cmr4 [Niveispirillum irakense]|uniref:type III-B CRISPR module RAMP protein Cmr4 n=1 Tax=Niveispirillum irakense TaxID=34011 RepID=UPI00042308F0|nr:type III-B CRISPR module RAMP protein Cmr4 [Niveispirillum irakense]
MSALVLGLLAETPIHPGSGQDDGTVDLPVQREKTTSYPVIPGSSVKGALRDYVRQQLQKDKEPEDDKEAEEVKKKHQKKVDDWFGKPENAGNILVSDGRLLLLPVRSLTGAYRWLTCPHLIERLRRDLQRAGLPTEGLSVPALPLGKDTPPVLTRGATGEKLFLEERSFEVAGAVSAELVAAIGTLIDDEGARARLAGQIAVVGDDDFAWFARYALNVQARNNLDPDRKTSKNLWYEETLPPDSLFYTMLVPRVNKPGSDAKSAVDGLHEMVGKRRYLQMGGNETVGQGWFLAKPLRGEG